jgi:hypothetical protein
MFLGSKHLLCFFIVNRTASQLPLNVNDSLMTVKLVPYPLPKIIDEPITSIRDVSFQLMEPV